MKEYKEDYCSCCKKNTKHLIRSMEKNQEGTGGDLVCTVCQSTRLDTIQGMNAALM